MYERASYLSGLRVPEDAPTDALRRRTCSIPGRWTSVVVVGVVSSIRRGKSMAVLHVVDAFVVAGRQPEERDGKKRRDFYTFRDANSERVFRAYYVC